MIFHWFTCQRAGRTRSTRPRLLIWAPLALFQAAEKLYLHGRIQRKGEPVRSSDVRAFCRRDTRRRTAAVSSFFAFASQTTPSAGMAATIPKAGANNEDRPAIAFPPLDVRCRTDWRNGGAGKHEKPGRLNQPRSWITSAERPSARITVSTICGALRRASSYIFCGLLWS